MTCDEAEILLHALIDGELDAGHAREVEAHLATCARCAAAARDYREMRKVIAQGGLRYAAPPELRRRIEASLPQVEAPTRRAVLKGFALGSAVSAIAASGLFAVLLRGDDEERLQNAFVSAHLRSLQPNHLTDVISTDQHTVKPWFNGRLDYIDGRPVGAVIYRHRQHVINLFVAQSANTEPRAPKMDTVHGFNVRRWSDRGLDYWAVSDLAKEELATFGEKIEAATRAAG
jgi:anti-sigma factor RsiW